MEKEFLAFLKKFGPRTSASVAVKHIFDCENVRVGCADDFLERANEVDKSEKSSPRHAPTSRPLLSAAPRE